MLDIRDKVKKDHGTFTHALFPGRWLFNMRWLVMRWLITMRWRCFGYLLYGGWLCFTSVTQNQQWSWNIYSRLVLRLWSFPQNESVLDVSDKVKNDHGSLLRPVVSVSVSVAAALPPRQYAVLDISDKVKNDHWTFTYVCCVHLIQSTLCWISVTKSKMIIKHLLTGVVGFVLPCPGPSFGTLVPLDISDKINDHGTFTHARCACQWCSLIWSWFIFPFLCWKSVTVTKSKMSIKMIMEHLLTPG